ncbi:MAG: hypothetical protein K2N12_00965 [Helicobacter sp.]|nr:hypothetical protein [Helicobacter sp.]
MKVIGLDMFDRNGEFLGIKRIYINDKAKSINQWIKQFVDTQSQELCTICCKGTDFQNSNFCNINFWDSIKGVGNAKGITKLKITKNNIMLVSIYFAVRHCIKATWINDRDQFLMPNKEWAKDREFQNDCLAFMLFHGQNRITSKEGTNPFIPFSETDVGAKEAFESDFMICFISGKIKQDSACHSEALAEESRKNLKRDVAPTQHNKKEQNGFDEESFYVENLIPTEPLEFSEEAKAVFAAGLKLWQYYHSQDFHDSKNPYNPNASLYDIKAYFQGLSASGRMNPPQKAKDSYYKDLIGNLNYELENLAKKIEPKVYEYEFLLE